MSDTTKENRLWQMRRLVKLCGGSNAAALKINRAESYVTAIAGPNPKRSIGDKMATHIETAFSLQPGELDQPPPAQMSRKYPMTDATVEVMSGAGDAAKELIFQFADWIVRKEMNAKPSAGKINLEFEAEALNSSSTQKKKTASIPKPNAKLIQGNQSKR